MEFQRLYLSEKKTWFSYLQNSCLIWPFYLSHSDSRAAILQQVSQKPTFLVSLAGSPSFIVQLTVVEERGIVENFLLIRETGQKVVILMLEQLARRLFCRQLLFSFSTPDSAGVFQCLNYQKTASGWLKTLTYKYGLVFGGGGSHGAYQVGVWQALKEAKIPIEVVTGTSVGALNGALFAQGDFAEAKELWEKLSTDAVLSFPAAVEQGGNLRELMEQMASLTSHALLNRGVSAEPLKRIMADLISHEKMAASPVAFFFVTTQVRALQEVRISYQHPYKEEWLNWLLASASFFPAMEVQRIQGEDYMDGGYRNNIPADIAYGQDVTDCFIVDVKGPGVTKPIITPLWINNIQLHSPWPLGSFLLFSPRRSQLNLRLGYLETLKALGRLQGFWYSFEVEEDLQVDWLHFYRQWLRLTGGEKVFLAEGILRKMRKFYKDRVFFENCGQVFIEWTAKYVGIEPTEIYTYNGLKAKIKQCLTEGSEGLPLDLSVTEWLEKYYRELIPLAEEKQVERIYSLLINSSKEDLRREVASLYKKLPAATLLGTFLVYIERGEL